MYGGSNDLQIYHDGSHSYIKDVGAGNLWIGGVNVHFGNPTASEYYIQTISNGAVTLYYDNSAKLATTSSGVNIVGTVVSDGLTVDGADVFFNSGWIKSNSSLRIDIDNDNNQTDRAFFISHGNASKDIFKASENGDISFYDDTGSTQGFFWDSSAESLGIGTTSPSEKLTVAGIVKSNGFSTNTAGVSNFIAGVNAGNSIISGGEYNTLIGDEAGTSITTGDFNVAVGTFSLDANTTAGENTAIGYASLSNNITGTRNVASGFRALQLNTAANDNTATGYFSLYSTTGSNNTAIGKDAGKNITTGSKNTIIGSFDGNEGGLDIRTANNHIVLSDGDGNPRQVIDSSGRVGIGTSSPSSQLHVNTSATGTVATFTGSASNRPFTLKNYDAGISGSGYIFDAESSFGAIALQTTSKNRLTINNGGDISFYDDTGSTQGLFWDASAESLGIGTTTPSYTLDVRDDSNIQLKLSSTTATNNARMVYAINNVTKWNVGVQASDGSYTFYDNSSATTPIKIEPGAAANTFVVDTNSRIGIGTSSPSSALDVTGTVTSDGLTVGANDKIQFGTSDITGIYRTNSGSDFTMQHWGNLSMLIDSDNNDSGTRQFMIGRNSQDASTATKIALFSEGGDISFYDDTGSTQGFFWDSSAESLGIGTTSPSAALHISGTSANQIRLERTNHDTFRIGLQSAVGLGFHNVTDNRTDMMIKGDGNVGIGTSSPDALLHLSANTGATLRLESTDTAIAANEVIGAIEWEGNDATTGSSGIAGKIDVIAEDATPEYSMRFFTQDNLSGTYELAERMRIKSDGKVGIGTVSPGEKLTVGGNTLTYGSTGNVGAGASYFLGNSQNSRDIALTRVDSATLAIGYYSSGWQESARFDSSGNFLVSTTSTSPWTNSANSSSDNGIALRNDGIIAASAYKGTANSGNVAILNRTGTDGGILSFYKSGATVGSISSYSGSYLAVGNNTSGLAFIDAGSPHSIRPHNLTTNSSSDDVLDLGTSSTRFKNLHLSGTANVNKVVVGDGTDSGVIAPYNLYLTSGNSNVHIFNKADGSEKSRLDASGNLLVGKTSANIGTVGHQLLSDSGGDYAAHTSNGTRALLLNRLTSDGEILDFRKDGSTQGNIGTTGIANGVEIYIASGSSSSVGAGLSFANVTISNYIAPCRGDGSYADNLIDLGTSSARFDDIYATNGTIQTSDRNEKQDIEAITDAETRVAVACKGLIRKFRWQDAVEEKGDDARLHFGVIAQDLQDAFTAEGLDAGDYGMFISSTWEDDDGVEQTRLGVRYNELLAFIITTL
jgi:hypothetical protein